MPNLILACLIYSSLGSIDVFSFSSEYGPS
jgi:hypothetical protein